MAASRTQAQDFVSSGYVYLLNGEKKTVLNKPSFEVTEENSTRISVEQNPLQKYVSRGGLKLESALKTLDVDVVRKSALDVGQSTGGFTDCLLQAGVAKVVGVDVGHGQLHEKLKTRDVAAFENLNVKDLASNSDFKALVPAGGFDLLVMDVSFISVTKVIPYVTEFLATGGDYLILVKPQFECGQENLDKNGIVKNRSVYAEIEKTVKECALKYFKDVRAYIESDLAGKDGNQEFFIYGKKAV
jgi:23S rRNA (cytidine1920-2'-O)/16S rRNA (cytidine1409-2'-O)-methyltransferase